MKEIIKWMIPAIAVGVVVFLSFFLLAINSQDDQKVSEELQKDRVAIIQKPEKTWLNHFANAQRQGYSYPVNEVYVKLDLNEKITKTITYKLHALVEDPYEMFCLKEELRVHKLKYYLKKDKSGMDLLIYSQDVKKLNKLVQVLKKYKIKAYVEPYKEEY